ncbi:AtpZ/AtpI family protein [Pleomorphomonas sp. NRK KF1]|uniref:AtpZ/AtpI family protein n=1 Tax=Pleomorphomonas sp. NRK KF1 TaxID=2943000 RepID=UPI002044A5A2|nr:AtpZ/AtpI family protein [Pleomorphomonas sp. NRK KF1]MCM5552654.1 AtpZ/AtpI family protein [Pleomorphomonas sp. NRK KF1]
MGQDDERSDDAGSDPRLRALGEKLAGARRDQRQTEGGAPQSSGLTGIGQAMKVGSEFVAGVIVGFVIGYTIDRLFGTGPWGMIVFLLLGFAAGTLNVMRATGVARDPFASNAGKSSRRAPDGDK